METKKEKEIVCMQWVREKCKKGEHCDYLHIYDYDKLPIC
jgi:hypothetical protein